MDQTAADARREKKPVDLKKELLEWAKAIAIAFAAFLIIHNFLFTMILVDGPSMLETLQDQDRVAATIIDLKINGPQRGDIVISYYPSGSRVVKRVVGMPGDKLEIKHGVTFINGELYEEPYVTHPKQSEYFGPIELGEDQYFVMGDNRAISHDSRFSDVGPLSKSDIVAKVRLRVWPLDSFGLLE